MEDIRFRCLITKIFANIKLDTQPGWCEKPCVWILFAWIKSTSTLYSIFKMNRLRMLPTPFFYRMIPRENLNENLLQKYWWKFAKQILNESLIIILLLIFFKDQLKWNYLWLINCEGSQLWKIHNEVNILFHIYQLKQFIINESVICSVIVGYISLYDITIQKFQNIMLRNKRNA